MHRVKKKNLNKHKSQSFLKYKQFCTLYLMTNLLASICYIRYEKRIIFSILLYNGV